MADQKEGTFWRLGKELIGLIILLCVGTCGICLCMAGKAANDAKHDTTSGARP